MNFMHKPKNQQDLDKKLTKLRKYHSKQKDESLKMQGITTQNELNVYNERVSQVAKKLELKLKENEQLLKATTNTKDTEKQD